MFKDEWQQTSEGAASTVNDKCHSYEANRGRDNRTSSNIHHNRGRGRSENKDQYWKNQDDKIHNVLDHRDKERRDKDIFVKRRWTDQDEMYREGFAKGRWTGQDEMDREGFAKGRWTGQDEMDREGFAKGRWTGQDEMDRERFPKGRCGDHDQMNRERFARGRCGDHDQMNRERFARGRCGDHDQMNRERFARGRFARGRFPGGRYRGHDERERGQTPWQANRGENNMNINCSQFYQRTQHCKESVQSEENSNSPVATTTATSVTIKPLQITIGDRKTAKVACITNPQDFYLQISDSSELLTLMDMIAADVKSKDTIYGQKLRKGSVCLVRNPDYDTWYRAVVENVVVSVFFCDYGNKANVLLTDIKEINTEHVDLPAQVLRCSLLAAKPNNVCWSTGEINYFKIVTEGKILEAIFVSQNNGRFNVILEDKGSIINSHFGATAEQLEAEASIRRSSEPALIEQKFSDQSFLPNTVEKVLDTQHFEESACLEQGEEGTSNLIAPTVTTNVTIKPASITIGDVKTVQVAFMSNPQNFYVQESACLEQGEEGTSNLIVPTVTTNVTIKPASITIGDVKTVQVVFMSNPQNFYVQESACLEQGEEGTSNLIAPTVTTNVTIKPASITIGDVKTVQVVFMSNPQNFYVQVYDSLEFNTLLDTLAEEGTSTGEINALTLKKGSVCIARYAEDDSWYRAVVESVSADSALVFFCDYGNKANVPFTDIKEIKSEHIHLPAQGIPCSLLAAKPKDECWSTSENDLFESVTHEKSFEATFVSQNDGKFDVILKDGESLINLQFGATAEQLEALAAINSSQSVQIEQNVSHLPFPPNAVKEVLDTHHFEESAYLEQGEEGTSNLIAPNVTSNVTIKPASITIGDVKTVQVVFMSNPQNFYVQVYDSLEFNTLLDTLAEEGTSTGEINALTLKQGSVCIARYAEDDSWYRAVVESVSADSALVFFCDYGNKANVPFTDIKEIKSEHIHLPAQGIPCSLLAAKPKDECWSTSENDLFESVTDEKTFEATFVSQNDGKFDVILKDGESLINLQFGATAEQLEALAAINSSQSVQIEQNVSHLPFPPNAVKEVLDTHHFEESAYLEQGEEGTSNLIAPNVTSNVTIKPASITIGDVKTVQVVFMSNPQNFYVQVYDSLEFNTLLDTLAEEGTSTGEINALTLKKGSVCIARYAEDDSWYRAVVESVSADSALVFFCDYGNKANVPFTDIKEIKSEHIHLPAQGIPCSLLAAKPKDECWSTSENDLFESVTDEKSFEATFVSQNDGKFDVILKDGESLINLQFGATAEQLEALAAINSSQSVQIEQNVSHLPFPPNAVKEVLDTHHFEESACLEQGEEGTSNLIAPNVTSNVTIKPASITIGDVKTAEVVFMSNPQNFNVQESACLEQGEEGCSNLIAPTVTSNVTIKPASITTGDVNTVEEVLTSNPQNFYVQESACLEQGEEGCSNLIAPTVTSNVTVKPASITTGDVKAVEEVLTSNPQNFYVQESSCLEQNEEGCSNLIAPTDTSCMTIKPPRISIGDIKTVELVFMSSPQNFYIKVPGSSELSNCPIDMIAADATSAGAVSAQALKKGSVCIARYAEDDSWYRAVVESVSAESALVFFCDYGNKANVPFTDIKEIKSEHIHLPAQGIPCSLFAAKPQDVSWSESEIDCFRDATEGKTLEATFISQNNGRFEVILKDSESIINLQFGATAEQLETIMAIERASEPSQIEQVIEIKPKFSQQSFLVNAVEQVSITCFINPEQFYCQLKSSRAAMNEMMTSIQEAYISKSPTSHPFHVGLPVIAKCIKNGYFYRAEVKDIENPGSITLHFVDYGIVGNVTDTCIWDMEERFMNLPKQAVLCSLQGVKPVNEKWSQSDTKKYFEAEEFQCTFHRFVEEKFEVSLVHNGINVANDLIEAGLARKEILETASEMSDKYSYIATALLFCVVLSIWQQHFAELQDTEHHTENLTKLNQHK